MVSYYFTAEDVRDIQVSNPRYTIYQPYTYEIDSGAFFNDVDLLLTAAMTIMFFAMIYVSLGKGIIISLKAQKRKARRRMA